MSVLVHHLALCTSVQSAAASYPSLSCVVVNVVDTGSNSVVLILSFTIDQKISHKYNELASADYCSAALPIPLSFSLSLSVCLSVYFLFHFPLSHIQNRNSRRGQKETTACSFSYCHDRIKYIEGDTTRSRRREFHSSHTPCSLNTTLLPNHPRPQTRPLSTRPIRSTENTHHS